MAIEIERKFSLKDENILKSAIGLKKIKQSYFSDDSVYFPEILLKKDGSGNNYHVIKMGLENSLNGKEYKIPNEDGVEISNGGFKKECRIRTVTNESGDRESFLTIKSKKVRDEFGRKEFEYKIPNIDADEFSKFGSSYILKDRYIIPYKENNLLNWEVDVFKDANVGLIIAEIELPYESYNLKAPDWLGDEVTNDDRYNSNKNLSLNNKEKEVKQNKAFVFNKIKNK
jgi:adenylate cyclase